MALPWSKLFLIVAFVLFLLAALVGGGVISMGGNAWEWEVAGGLAAFVLAGLL